MASFISSWHSAMAFSILCGAVAGDRHLFYLTKKKQKLSPLGAKIALSYLAG
jgi:hypothetical protein